MIIFCYVIFCILRDNNFQHEEAMVDSNDEEDNFKILVILLKIEMKIRVSSRQITIS